MVDGGDGGIGGRMHGLVSAMMEDVTEVAAVEIMEAEDMTEESELELDNVGVWSGVRARLADGPGDGGESDDLRFSIVGRSEKGSVVGNSSGFGERLDADFAEPFVDWERRGTAGRNPGVPA